MTSRKVLLAAVLASSASFAGAAFAYVGHHDAMSAQNASLSQAEASGVDAKAADASVELAQLRPTTSRDNRYIGDDIR